jgi:hypothetical protein
VRSSCAEISTASAVYRVALERLAELARDSRCAHSSLETAFSSSAFETPNFCVHAMGGIAKAVRSVKARSSMMMEIVVDLRFE